MKLKAQLQAKEQDEDDDEDDKGRKVPPKQRKRKGIRVGAQQGRKNEPPANSLTLEFVHGLANSHFSSPLFFTLTHFLFFSSAIVVTTAVTTFTTPHLATWSTTWLVWASCTARQHTSRDTTPPTLMISCAWLCIPRRAL